MSNIDLISFSIGFGVALLFYLVVAVIAALVLAKRADRDNDKIFEKKSKEAGFWDIWE